jgi:hypothetical protein
MPPNSQLLYNLAGLQRGLSTEIVNHYNVQPVFDIYANVDQRDLKPHLPKATKLDLRGRRKPCRALLSLWKVGGDFGAGGRGAYPTSRGLSSRRDGLTCACCSVIRDLEANPAAENQFSVESLEQRCNFLPAVQWQSGVRRPSSVDSVQRAASAHIGGAL